jgi:hypothetical protein
MATAMPSAVRSRRPGLPRRSAAAFKVDGFKVDGFKVDGFKVDGFKVDGFKVDGFKVDGFKVDGFKVDGEDISVAGDPPAARVGGLPLASMPDRLEVSPWPGS